MLSALHEDIVSSGDQTGSSAEDTGGRCCGGQVSDGEELSSAVGDLKTEQQDLKLDHSCL